MTSRFLSFGRAVVAVGLCAAGAQAQVQLFDNGDFVTGHGTGAGGADVSVIQTGIVPSLGNGYNVAPPQGPIRIADNFVVTGNGWDLTSMQWYEVQSQTALYTDFRFVGAYVEVFLGNPRLGGTLVAGDMTTNRLTGGAWTGAYRVSSSGQTSATRPIFRLDIDMSWMPVLPPGEYYVSVSAAGDAGTPGAVGSIPVPQQPGHRAEQFFNQAWVTTVIPIDFPFKLFGTVVPPCGTSDFDGDGDFGTDADIEAFFACLGGNCCALCFPGGSDFDGDGDSGTDADIEAFFRVLGGSPC